jgi:type II secretion system protein C
MEVMNMQKLSSTSVLKVISRLLILLVIAKVISLVLLYVLPSDGVELRVDESYQPTYQRVDFKNMLTSSIAAQKSSSKQQASSGINITNMVLKGLYGKGGSGFIIVALKSKPDDTSIVGIGEEYSGFKLVQIGNLSAIFEKGGTNFTLYLNQGDSVTTNYYKTKEVRAVENQEGPISQKVVNRNDIAFYAKNPKQIWREISIVEVKDGKDIKGFKVTRIDPRSKMATLGLRKNDLIIKANNVVLKSYRDALNIYSKIKDIDVLQLVVIRDGVQKEIVYEIN